MARILAIDYGQKRIGIAVTDPLQMIANGLTTVETPKIYSFLAEYFTKEELANLSEEEIEKLLEERKNETATDTAQYQPTDIEYYLQQLPFSEKQQKEANEQILQALNNIGYIYYDNLEDYKNSIESYTELNERYPGNEHELSSWYYLYKMHTTQNNASEGNLYKDKIIIAIKQICMAQKKLSAASCWRVWRNYCAILFIFYYDFCNGIALFCKILAVFYNFINAWNCKYFPTC